MGYNQELLYVAIVIGLYLLILSSCLAYVRMHNQHQESNSNTFIAIYITSFIGCAVFYTLMDQILISECLAFVLVLISIV